MPLIGRLDDLERDLAAAAEPDRAPAMAAYMKDRFEFLGVAAPARRRASTTVVRAARRAPAGELVEFADACWVAPHRELQYVGADVLRAGAGNLRPADLDHVRRYVVTKAWWDTVDSLAAWTVGPLVARHRQLALVMDEWIDQDDVWLARTAILHQLGYGDSTDAERLFAYCDRRADDPEFFVRKALGWALRQYARVAPDEVRAYVEGNGRLSGLTRREALKHLT